MSGIGSPQRIISNINKFSDLAHSSRFSVRFSDIPGSTTDLETLELRCESVNIPGKSLSTFDNRTYGPILKFPTQTIFEEISITVICSGNKDNLSGSGYIERRMFEDWINYINPYQVASGGNPDIPYHNFRYRDEYVRNFTITCFDMVNAAESYQIEVVDAFPTNVSGIAMSWAAQDIAKFNVTFAYERFYRKTQPTDDYVAGTEALSTQIPRVQHPNPQRIPEGLRTEDDVRRREELNRQGVNDPASNGPGPGGAVMP